MQCEASDCPQAWSEYNRLELPASILQRTGYPWPVQYLHVVIRYVRFLYLYVSINSKRWECYYCKIFYSTNADINCRATQESKPFNAEVGACSLHNEARNPKYNPARAWVGILESIGRADLGTAQLPQCWLL
jgi:hypothetical protein